MNAARILELGGVDLEELRPELGPVRPEQINVWPAAKFVRLLWRSGIRGVTLWRLVLADPAILDEDPKRRARFVVHELVHVRQFTELGYLRFTARYVKEYVAGRLRGQNHNTAYRAISAEIEARDIAARHV